MYYVENLLVFIMQLTVEEFLHFEHWFDLVDMLSPLLMLTFSIVLNNLFYYSLIIVIMGRSVGIQAKL